ncbi:MAG: nucleotide-binding universal stress UspA family protein [Desulforhopalus sp.]|jgi:nucleotide-binding universal stress UspA family protein
MRLQPKQIMCAVDFSESTRQILAYSVALCKEFHAKLFLVHIVDDMTTSSIDSEIAIGNEILQKRHISKAQESLEFLVKNMTIEYEIVIDCGNAANTISQLALKKHVDMVITASHGKSGFERLLIGSVTEKLIKIIHCPLLVIRTKGHDFISQDSPKMKLKKILVGCDFSADSKLAFDYGLSLAQEFQADLFLAHVIKPTEHITLNPSDYINVLPGNYHVWGTADYFEIQQKVTEENREKMNTLHRRLEKQLHLMVPEECQAWCTPHATLLTGEPYRELLKYAKEYGIDMIVLGTRGHTLWEKLMVGSTTERVLREAPCPVLTVRPMEAANK